MASTLQLRTKQQKIMHKSTTTLFILASS